MGLYPVSLCYNAIQDNTIGKYNKIQYHTITHHTEYHTSHKITYNTQGIPLYSNYKKNQEYITFHKCRLLIDE